MQQVYLTWHDVEELISQLVFKLDTPYDAILVVTRGGIIPGGMIAEALKMKEVLTATVLFPEEDSTHTRLAWPRFLQFPPDAVLENRKVLVVDNLWHRGHTITAVRGRVEAAGGFPQTAVLHWKQQSSRIDDEPDHYVETTEDFIHYPWQRIDDSDYRIRVQPRVPLS